ncbi:MAG: 4-hydroxythreonine-4-phosphate dehydrogenase PdxA [Ardenticatenaceae bacterium]|nr:4-hydroxythreonine-4-phosphate dehydrogenase PdxA [Ardenticatenaceae bacterium]
MGGKRRPIIAITMGDPAGIGPEVVVKALVDPATRQLCQPFVVGHPAHLERAVTELGLPVEVVAIASTEELPAEGLIPCWTVGMPPPEQLPRAQVSAAAGRAAYALVETAARLALEGHADAIATAPLHKESLRLAGVQESGHTEILARLCRAERVSMLLVVEGLRVSHVTTHVALRRVADLVTTERVLEVIRLTDGFLAQLGLDRRRIGVLGLNPHAGEHGLFGDEDDEQVAPAVLLAREAGIDAEGPLPADTAIHWAHTGRYDALVAMYHDQGHVPVKLLDFSGGVNVTLGLPIIRTSVDHGTAFDIVGKGAADPSSMLAAIRLAAQVAAGADGGR